MIKTLVIGLSLLTINIASGQENIAKDSSYANGYYVERLNYFEKLPRGKKEIVFMGNSITEVGAWQEIILKGRAINRGISGDNSYGVRARLDEALSSKPKKIFIMIGVNDIKRGTSIEDIAGNYERIIRDVKLKSPKTELYMQSVLPVNEKMLASIYDLIRNEKIIKLNHLLKNLCEKYKLTYVDLNQDVFSDENRQLPENLTTDGLHLKPASYLLWVNYLQKKKYL